jgi:hypothetical protein
MKIHIDSHRKRQLNMLTPWIKFYITWRGSPRNIILICRSDLQRPAFHNHNFVGDWLALEVLAD